MLTDWSADILSASVPQARSAQAHDFHERCSRFALRRTRCPRSDILLPRPSHRMRLSVEDNLIEVECPGRSKQEVEILESLGEKEALH